MKVTIAIDRVAKCILFACVALTIATTFTVVVLLGKETYGFFQTVGIADFLFGTKWAPLLEPKAFGVLPLVVGTLKIVVGAIVLAVPAGMMAAIYLSEYSTERTRTYLKPALELLAGVPTVVYGYFALTFVTPLLKQIYPETEIFNATSAAIVVGIMILPMICSLCDDAFRAVPRAIREGAYGLGANTFEVISQVVVPSSLTRIAAAVVLAVSRAIGETMAVTLAAGATPNLSFNPLESIQTMTAFIVQVTLGDAPAGGPAYLSSFAVGTLLFLMTLTMNVLGNHFIFKVKASGA